MSIDLNKILASLHEVNPKQLPPVHLWNPVHVGKIDIVIDEQMRWLHEGTFFQRDTLMRLFASILRLDDDQYYLVTPVEKLRITVADVPFEIISCIQSDTDKNLLLLITNTENIIKLDKKTHWQLRDFHGIDIPYIEVRNGLFARVNRAVYYQMIEIAELKLKNEKQEMILVSGGREFLLGEYTQ